MRHWLLVICLSRSFPLAFETVACEVTTGDNPYHSGDFHLAVAKRSEVSPLIEV